MLRRAPGWHTYVHINNSQTVAWSFTRAYRQVKTSSWIKIEHLLLHNLYTRQLVYSWCYSSDRFSCDTTVCSWIGGVVKVLLSHGQSGEFLIRVLQHLIERACRMLICIGLLSMSIASLFANTSSKSPENFVPLDQLQSLRDSRTQSPGRPRDSFFSVPTES
jgi:hypothetical protein